VPDKSTRLTKLKNFGPKSAEWLNEIGVYTLEDVEREGVVEVYKRVKDAFPHKVSLNMLWGLQAAVLGIHWNAVPPEMRAELKAQLDDNR
jgi:DNA transformation protein and related proteins